MNAINKFNLTKTAFMSHAITTKNYNSKRSEKSFKLIFSPCMKKNETGL